MIAQVFISYAHLDNQPFADETMGWVSYVAEHLEKAVNMKLTAPKIKCWMDHRLEHNRVVDEALRMRIEESACIVSFMSPSYIGSNWCQKEMNTFLALRQGKPKDSVFLVEFLPTQRETWHVGARNLSAFSFWSENIEEPEPKTLGWPVPNPKLDAKYWKKLNRLAFELAEQIKLLYPSSVEEDINKDIDLPEVSNSCNPHPTVDPNALNEANKVDIPHQTSTSKIIWLAEPNDDVLDRWEHLAAILKEKGHRILPGDPNFYPKHDELLYQKALQADLNQADCLVQLLGQLSGKKLTGTHQRLVQIQAKAATLEAKKRDCPRLVWRMPEIVLETITDADYLNLLNQASPEDIKTFIQKILDRLYAEKPKPNAFGLNVLINADKPDRKLGQQVKDLLETLEVDATLAAEPLPSQVPKEYFRDLENLLNLNHGVLIVYGETPPTWVQVHSAFATKILAFERKGLWGGLLEGPPEQKPEYDIGRKNLRLLNCRKGVELQPLQQFVQDLRRGVAGV